MAYLTRTFRAQAGIVISASHNAYEDNGIKFFAHDGTKLPDEIEFEIEEYLGKDITTVDSQLIGKASRISDASGRYIEYCKSTIPSGIKLSGLSIVVDCAHGSTYNIASNVLRELGANVKTIGVSPNGLNINADCGSTSPEQLVKEVLAEGADIGIAFDGDGDRVIMVDHLGNVVDGDEIIYVIARDRRRRNVEFGGVAGTLMSNLGLQLGLEALDIPFARAKVGDRYVMSELQSRDWQLGGESSGHIICLDVASTGDGVVAALQILFAMVSCETSLYELRNKMSKFPQTMINVRMAQKCDPSSNPKVQEAMRAVEATLGKKGRVLLRPSGTEPVVRVMVEGEDAELVERLAKELAISVEQAIA